MARDNKEWSSNFLEMERVGKVGWIYRKSSNFSPPEEEPSSERLTGISPSERLGSLFQTGLYSDCILIADGVELKTHRLVLSIASPHFESLLMTPDPIELPFSLRTTQLILKHCYLQDLDVENIDETQDLIEAAHQLGMSDLVELCCASIEPAMLDDLFPAMNLACRYGSRALKETCLNMASRNRASILMHEGFLALMPEAVSLLLTREVVEVDSETEVIDAVMRWARNRCESLESETDDIDAIIRNEMRKQLDQSEILLNLRFLSLSEDDFVQFLTGTATEIFTPAELATLENDYYSSTPAVQNRTERTTETRITICGFDYISANPDHNSIETVVKIHQNTYGTRPIIKMLIVPSQINPANILYDNVSHKTHYDEFVHVEVVVSNRVIGRGSFTGRIKYGEDIFILVNTFNSVPVYAEPKPSDLEIKNDFYVATVKITFGAFGYYPLAVETKGDCWPIELVSPSRYIHEFVITTPKL